MVLHRTGSSGRWNPVELHRDVHHLPELEKTKSGRADSTICLLLECCFCSVGFRFSLYRCIRRRNGHSLGIRMGADHRSNDGAYFVLGVRPYTRQHLDADIYFCLVCLYAENHWRKSVQ